MNTQKGFSKILLIIIGLLVVGGGVYFYNTSFNEEILETNTEMQDEDPLNNFIEDGKYIVYLVNVDKENLTFEIVDYINNDGPGLPSPKGSGDIRKIDFYQDASFGYFFGVYESPNEGYLKHNDPEEFYKHFLNNKPNKDTEFSIEVKNGEIVDLFEVYAS